MSTRIKQVYKECLDYQFQLNLNANLIRRLRLGHTGSTSISSVLDTDTMKQKPDLASLVANMSQDKLRVCNGLLIKTLLCLTYQLPGPDRHLQQPRLDLATACQLFRDLCVYGNFERECSWLLLRCCCSEAWWGEFISACLRKFFVSKVKEVTPLSRAFITLSEMCVRSLGGEFKFATY